MARNLYYDQLVALASVGGYSLTTRLSDLTGVFLLSACWVLAQRWLWQTPLQPISDAEFQNILDMIANAEYELMTNFAIGQIISTVSDISSNTDVLLLDGSTIDGNDYPELLAVVPASWVTGTDITLPDMTQTGVFGENGDVGDIVGENSHQLSVAEIPSHTHIQDSHGHSYTLTTGVNTAAGLEPALASLVTSVPSTTGLVTATNQNTGGDASHNNIQQSLSVYWWIVAR